ncbi:MAG: HPr family phosphocarrier protein [Oscillospiraceae bacterium]|nr:HPr family phosphocarrier protein [Oscillospiraceae bacterium]
MATKYPYDIWVHGQSGMADAKSILGLMLFTLEKDLKLVVDDGADTKALEKDIAEFLA